MRKIIAILIVLCITASLFALEEVRGVQTRVSKYSADGIASSLVRGECGVGDNMIYLAGFELTNENNYPVWVEVELYNGQSVIDTKNITLEAGESYLWKTHIVATCMDCEWGKKCRDYYEKNEIQKYFIKYKAYKADTGKKSNNVKKKVTEEEESESAGFAVTVAPKQEEIAKPAASQNVPQSQWSSRSTSKMGGVAAINYCRQLNEGGFTDWRLPTIEAIKACHECKITSEDDGIWTSSPTEDPYKMWFFFFHDGDTSSYATAPTNHNHFVRCVR